MATSGGLTPPPTRTSNATASAARQRFISPRIARAVTPTIAGSVAVRQQPDDLRLRVQRDVHVKEVRARARDSRNLVQPWRDAAQAVVHRPEAAEIDEEDGDVLRDVLRNVQELARARRSTSTASDTGPRIPYGYRARAAGFHAWSSRPRNSSGLMCSAGLAVVELYAAAVSGRNEQCEHDEERRHQRSLERPQETAGRAPARGFAPPAPSRVGLSVEPERTFQGDGRARPEALAKSSSTR